MAFSNQSLSSWVVNLSANTREHSCFQSEINVCGFEMTSATAFSMPYRYIANSSNSLAVSIFPKLMSRTSGSHYHSNRLLTITITHSSLLLRYRSTCSRGVDPYGTGGHVPQYLDWGTLSRMSPSIFLE